MNRAPLDIQKSKLTVVKYHSSRKGKTHLCLVFSTKQTKHRVKKLFMRGTKLKDTNEKSNTLTKHSHDCKGK